MAPFGSSFHYASIARIAPGLTGLGPVDPDPSVPSWSGLRPQPNNTIAERNEKKTKKGEKQSVLTSSPFCFVFFRFFRLYSLLFFRFFLLEKQDVAPLQCRVALPLS